MSNKAELAEPDDHEHETGGLGSGIGSGSTEKSNHTLTATQSKQSHKSIKDEGAPAPYEPKGWKKIVAKLSHINPCFCCWCLTCSCCSLNCGCGFIAIYLLLTSAPPFVIGLELDILLKKLLGEKNLEAYLKSTDEIGTIARDFYDKLNTYERLTLSCGFFGILAGGTLLVLVILHCCCPKINFGTRLSSLIMAVACWACTVFIILHVILMWSSFSQFQFIIDSATKLLDHKKGTTESPNYVHRPPPFHHGPPFPNAPRLDSVYFTTDRSRSESEKMPGDGIIGIVNKVREILNGVLFAHTVICIYFAVCTAFLGFRYFDRTLDPEMGL